MKSTAKASDDLRAEYAFVSMAGGVRGKYAERYRQGVNIIIERVDIPELI